MAPGLENSRPGADCASWSVARVDDRHVSVNVAENLTYRPYALATDRRKDDPDTSTSG